MRGSSLPQISPATSFVFLFMFTLEIYVNKNKKATPFEVAFPMLLAGNFTRIRL
jgi:hypothetical protein